MASIRRAHQRDADIIARLLAQSAAERGTATAPDSERIRVHAFGQNALIEVWLAESRTEKPFGLAMISKSYDIRHAAPQIVVCELYVAPDHRRDGVARLLIAAAAQRARGMGACELTITTGVDDAVAQRFFAAIGAREKRASVFMMSADGIEWLAAETL